MAADQTQPGYYLIHSKELERLLDSKCSSCRKIRIQVPDTEKKHVVQTAKLQETKNMKQKEQDVAVVAQKHDQKVEYIQATKVTVLPSRPEPENRPPSPDKKTVYLYDLTDTLSSKYEAPSDVVEKVPSTEQVKVYKIEDRVQQQRDRQLKLEGIYSIELPSVPDQYPKPTMTVSVWGEDTTPSWESIGPSDDDQFPTQMETKRTTSLQKLVDRIQQQRELLFQMMEEEGATSEQEGNKKETNNSGGSQNDSLTNKTDIVQKRLSVAQDTRKESSVQPHCTAPVSDGARDLSHTASKNGQELGSVKQLNKQTTSGERNTSTAQDPGMPRTRNEPEEARVSSSISASSPKGTEPCEEQQGVQ